MQDNFGSIRHTNHGMPPVLRPPARTIRDWPRKRLVQLTAAYAVRARRNAAPNIAYMLDSATDAMVALEAADSRLAGVMFELTEIRRQLDDAREDLRKERARNAALLAELGPERFCVPTAVAKSPLLRNERPTTPHGVVSGEIE